MSAPARDVSSSSVRLARISYSPSAPPAAEENVASVVPIVAAKPVPTNEGTGAAGSLSLTRPGDAVYTVSGREVDGAYVVPMASSRGIENESAGCIQQAPQEGQQQQQQHNDTWHDPEPTYSKRCFFAIGIGVTIVVLLMVLIPVVVMQSKQNTSNPTDQTASVLVSILRTPAPSPHPTSQHQRPWSVVAGHNG